jgi:hypothetical protein
MYYDLKFLEPWNILFVLLFIFVLIYSVNSSPNIKNNVTKQEILIVATKKDNEFKKIEGLKGRSSGGSIKNGILYDYWKVTSKDDKTYTIPKENKGLYNKIELNKSCFVTINTDVTPNIILDVKYCN